MAGHSNNNMPADVNFIPKIIDRVPPIDDDSLKGITNEKGRKLFVDKLGAPRLVVAPMVDASELAWRELARRRGANLCYTPMLHSGVFRRDQKYRQEGLQSCATDRPLIVQFCGNDPNIMLEAALFAQDHCDAIDINLGCPQAIAKRGKYGSYLQDDWPLLQNMVSLLSSRLSVPVTCKIRVFESIEHTVRYARMLEEAGCSMLTVHGRTREQKGPMTGLASWDHIRAVRQNVNIPVLANGNIQYLHDAIKCLEYTGAHGVMAAEGHLYNPAIFQGKSVPVWEIAEEYLELVKLYPAPSSYIRGHLFKLFQHIMILPENAEQRSQLAVAQNVEEYSRIVSEIRIRYMPYYTGEKYWNLSAEPTYNLVFPPWMCQPYVRPPPEEHLKKVEENQNKSADLLPKRNYEDADGNMISRKRMKKLRRIQRRPIRDPSEYVKRTGEYCLCCPNPIGDKCTYTLCKKCCKEKCYHENLDCAGHRILVKTRREIAIKHAAQRENGLNEAIVENDENRRLDTCNNSTQYMNFT
ncbi:tRNA-dihydrouridine(16/17) synthase [NAD(P)(+)]-like [Ctenocephalides felis]|uniref:tRNA-dihydrouridine(16/17) synthase [NAD(P)(+)]-like n=1 Tax=Ctenocephalides felis TaxID=7515 RepID=UPI000E6E328D|nr:tRNA-dihydrouridine(16/17) synthase [NAD(P)(+)]-like [Ctenocephalides felis]